MAVFSIFIFPKFPENSHFVHLANCRPLVTFTNLFRKAKSVSEYANHIVNYLGAGSIGHFTPSQVVQFSGATAVSIVRNFCDHKTARRKPGPGILGKKICFLPRICIQTLPPVRSTVHYQEIGNIGMISRNIVPGR